MCPDKEAPNHPEVDDGTDNTLFPYGESFLKVIGAFEILIRRYFKKRETLAGDHFYEVDGEMEDAEASEEEGIYEKSIEGTDLVALYEGLMIPSGWELSFSSPDDEDCYWTCN